MLQSITEVEKKYPNWYSESSELSKDDQQWIWENLPLPEEQGQTNCNDINDNAGVNGDADGGCKFGVNSELNWYKSDAISKLKKTNFDTPEYEKSLYLSEIFSYWPSKEKHWLFITQNHTSRVINWVMNETIKKSIRGGIKTNPARFFTYIIQFRTKRKDNKW